MSIPKEPDRTERFIHEIIHEIANEKELKEPMRDLISLIIDRWEEYKEEFFIRRKNFKVKCPKCNEEFVIGYEPSTTD